MEKGNKTEFMTHRQKMDRVIDGLDFLTTKEVEALIGTIEAFKIREEILPPYHPPNPMAIQMQASKSSTVCKLPGITFDARDVSRLLNVNYPVESPGLSIIFKDGTGHCSHFETEEERDQAAKDLSDLVYDCVGAIRPLSSISTETLVDELRTREGVSEHSVDFEAQYSLTVSDSGHLNCRSICNVGPARIFVVID